MATIESTTLIDRASSLNTLRSSSGWPLLVKWLSDRCDEAEFAMLSSTTTNAQELFALQRTARATRAMFDAMQHWIDAEITKGDRALQAKSAQVSTTNEGPLYGG